MASSGGTNAGASSAQSRYTTPLAALAVFFIALELTVISVALPALAQDFPSTAVPALNQLFTTYNWVTAVLLLVFGLVADRYGRKRAFLIGLVLFGLGSAGCGFSETFNSLLGFRVVQALGGALMAPASLALILAATQHSPKQRHQALAIWGTMAGLAAALGPLLGALVIELADWRWVFWAPIPLIVLTTAAGAAWLDESRSTATASPRNFSSGSFTPLRQPRTFWWPTLASVPFVAAFTAWLVSAPLFLVSVWQQSPTTAGIAIAPAPLAMAVTAGPAARLANRFGPLPVTCVACALGSLALLVWITQTTVQPDYLLSFLPAALLMGTAVGAGFPLLTAAAMQDVDTESYAVGSGIHTTARQLAMGIGAGSASWVFAHYPPLAATNTTPTLAAFQGIWQLCLVLFVSAALCIAVSTRQRAHHLPKACEPRRPNLNT